MSASAIVASIMKEPINSVVTISSLVMIPLRDMAPTIVEVWVLDDYRRRCGVHWRADFDDYPTPGHSLRCPFLVATQQNSCLSGSFLCCNAIERVIYPGRLVFS